MLWLLEGMQRAIHPRVFHLSKLYTPQQSELSAGFEKD